MKSHFNHESQKAAAQKGMADHRDFLPLIRLALLVVPEIVVFTALSRSPVICWLAAGAVLAVWLTVDVWPFRVETPVLARARIARQVQPVARRKMNKAEWMNYLFCRIIVFALMFHSKLTI